MTYDPATGTYSLGGVVIGAATVAAAAQSAVNQANASISTISLQFQQGTITWQAWYDAMQIEICNLHAANTALAHGGFASMDANAWARAVDAASDQLAYFDNFAAQVQASGTFTQVDLRRAGMYADAGRSTYENERVADMKTFGATEARRLLGAVDSCPDCVEWAGYDWIPIDDMLNDYPIGASVCLVRCHCAITTR